MPATDLILTTIERLNEHFLEGIAAGKTFSVETAPWTEILVCGMGGSVLAADLLGITAKDLGITLPLRIHRDYGLPERLSEHPLVFAVSHSGDTEETISAYAAALAGGFTTIAMAGGGKLEKTARENSRPFIAIRETEIPPRFAAPYMLGMLIGALTATGLVSPTTPKTTEADPSAARACGETLAKLLADRNCLIYTSSHYRSMGYFFKVNLNETAKQLAFSNVFPEWNHNELVSLLEGTPTGMNAVVILKAEDEPERILERMTLAETTLREKGIPVDTIELKGRTSLERTLYGMLVGYWTSVLLAQQRDIDPMTTASLERFKKKLP